MGNFLHLKVVFSGREPAEFRAAMAARIEQHDAPANDSA